MRRFKYEIVQKQENPFTFGLNAAENTHYTKKKKTSNKSYFQHRISDKKVREGTCVSPPRVELGGSKDDMV